MGLFTRTCTKCLEMTEKIQMLQQEVSALRGDSQEFYRGLHDMVCCRDCGRPLIFSAREVGDGLCHYCGHRAAVRLRSLADFLDDPNVLLKIPQPHRMELSKLLHDRQEEASDRGSNGTKS